MCFRGPETGTKIDSSGQTGKPDLDQHNKITAPQIYETVEQHSSVTVWTGSEL